MPFFINDNLLFVHIPKNAGKSVEIALGLAEKENLGSLGRRSAINRAFTLFQRLTSNKNAQLKLHGSLDTTLCAQHLTFQEISLLQIIPHSENSSIRSFAVVRNPIERALSTFFHFFENKEINSDIFRWFCENWYDQCSSEHNLIAHKRKQIDFILDCRGKIAVDRLLLFENLADDFSALCNNWNIHSAPIPHVGKSSSKDTANSLLTDETLSILQDRFEEDIALYESIRKRGI